MSLKQALDNLTDADVIEAGQMTGRAAACEHFSDPTYSHDPSPGVVSQSAFETWKWHAATWGIDALARSAYDGHRADRLHVLYSVAFGLTYERTRVSLREQAQIQEQRGVSQDGVSQ